MSCVDSCLVDDEDPGIGFGDGPFTGGIGGDGGTSGTSAPVAPAARAATRSPTARRPPPLPQAAKAVQAVPAAASSAPVAKAAKAATPPPAWAANPPPVRAATPANPAVPPATWHGDTFHSLDVEADGQGSSRKRVRAPTARQSAPALACAAAVLTLSPWKSSSCHHEQARLSLRCTGDLRFPQRRCRAGVGAASRARTRSPTTSTCRFGAGTGVTSPRRKSRPRCAATGSHPVTDARRCSPFSNSGPSPVGGAGSA